MSTIWRPGRELVRCRIVGNICCPSAIRIHGVDLVVAIMARIESYLFLPGRPLAHLAHSVIQGVLDVIVGQVRGILTPVKKRYDIDTIRTLVNKAESARKIAKEPKDIARLGGKPRLSLTQKASRNLARAGLEAARVRDSIMSPPSAQSTGSGLPGWYTFWQTSVPELYQTSVGCDPAGKHNSGQHQLCRVLAAHSDKTLPRRFLDNEPKE